MTTEIVVCAMSQATGGAEEAAQRSSFDPLSSRRCLASIDAARRSSIFSSTSALGKRDLWWSTYRKSVLQPCDISIEHDSGFDHVPVTLLDLLDHKYENLVRYRDQAFAFVEAIAAQQGFGPSPIFPPDAVPAAPHNITRCIEPTFSQAIIPDLTRAGVLTSIEYPSPRPTLASGFSCAAFLEHQQMESPDYLQASGCLADYASGQIYPDHQIFASFLMFERTFGSARHDIESANNYCAMNGASALRGFQSLYAGAWPHVVSDDQALPPVFTCAIDNDLAIIHINWLSNDSVAHMAPLCKFDFRDLEEFMHFLAWIEAIEQWADEFLLPILRDALTSLNRQKDTTQIGQIAKALPSPVSDAEKQQKLSHSMRLAFDNIPWKGERPRNIPLGATMRMRSPRVVAEPDSELTPTGPVLSSTAEALDVRKDLSIAVHQRGPQRGASHAHATSPPPTAPFPSTSLAELSPCVDRNTKSTPSSPAIKLAKKRRAPISLLALGSSGTSQIPTNNSLQYNAAPLTDVEPQSSRSVSTVASSKSMPMPNQEQFTTPGISENPGGPKSSTSFMSISSKKSYKSLRSARSLKSPGTPDSTITPKTGGFKSKLTNGLDAIKERTTPRRSRTADNAAPTSARENPLPTPAYDKKRFEIRPPTAPVPPTPKFWERALGVVGHEKDVAAVAAAYNASHVLPFRQYSKTSAAETVTTTITAGAAS